MTPYHKGGGGRSSKPTVLFSTGATCFNPAAVDLLKLKEGSKVAVHQDEEDTENFYLSLDDEKGFTLRLRDKTGKDKTLQFNCTSLARIILKAFHYEDDAKSISFKIIEEPTVFKKVTYHLLGHLPKVKP